MRPNGIKRPNALNGNDRIGLMKLFCIFHKSITYIPTDGPTDGRTDKRSYRVASERLKRKSQKRYMVNGFALPHKF